MKAAKAAEKGGPAAESNGDAKPAPADDPQRAEIFRLLATDLSQQKIADQVGCSRKKVRKINEETIAKV